MKQQPLKDKRFYFAILFGKEERRSVASPEQLRAIMMPFAEMLSSYRPQVSLKLVIESDTGGNVSPRQAGLSAENMEKALGKLRDGKFLALEAYDSRKFEEIDFFLELHKYRGYGPEGESERTSFVAENSLSIGVNTERLEGHLDFGSLVATLKDCFSRVDGIYGYADYGCPFGRPAETDPTFIASDLLSYRWHEVKEDFRCKKIDMSKQVIDIHWENYLAESHVERVGGVEALQRVFEVVEFLEPGRYYTRLTRAVPANDPDGFVEKLQGAREALRGILV
jgi:hypothetical protein